MLDELGEAVLHECPVGLVLRQTPFVYDLIRAGGYAENTGVEMLSQPRYLQEAVGLVGSERARLRELAQADRQATSDANYGAKILKRRR